MLSTKENALFSLEKLLKKTGLVESEQCATVQNAMTTRYFLLNRLQEDLRMVKLHYTGIAVTCDVHMMYWVFNSKCTVSCALVPSEAAAIGSSTFRRFGWLAVVPFRDTSTGSWLSMIIDCQPMVRIPTRRSCNC